ncbi:MAG: hypothetical protein IIY35_07050 [Ruminococcus sp.]|jgi:nitrogen fixation-related uncharacterized protein|nr:hypothetical protein [Ruminococcus sp.]
MANPKGNKKGGRPAPPPKEKVVVKKKGGCLVFLIILILLALLAFLLGLHFGWWGKGSGDGDGDGKSKKSGNSTSDTDKQAQKDVYVTVSGAKYIYENNTIEIEAFVNKIADIEGKPLVHITDDKATDSAMNELKSALNNSKISFVEEADDDTTTASATTK